MKFTHYKVILSDIRLGMTDQDSKLLLPGFDLSVDGLSSTPLAYDEIVAPNVRVTEDSSQS